MTAKSVLLHPKGMRPKARAPHAPLLRHCFNLRLVLHKKAAYFKQTSFLSSLSHFKIAKLCFNFQTPLRVSYGTV